MNGSEITLDDLLKRVSRSFTKAIQLLDPNKRKIVKVMYLLFRIPDTIEDSKLDNYQKKIFSEQFIEKIGKPHLILNEYFYESVKKGIIDEHDKILFNPMSIKKVHEAFQLINRGVKETAITQLRTMQEGTLKFQTDSIRINGVRYYCPTYEKLNEYCYFVAGTVGELLTDIVKITDNVELDRDKSINFGRLLQKVNIIKDVRKDFKEGRCYWPNMNDGVTELADIKEDFINISPSQLEEMILDAAEEIPGTKEYIASIPKNINGYLSFCRLISYMATETLLLAKTHPEIFTENRELKIPKISFNTHSFFSIYLTSKYGLFTQKGIENYMDETYKILRN